MKLKTPLQLYLWLDVFIRSLTRENEVEDTTAAVLMVEVSTSMYI